MNLLFFITLIPLILLIILITIKIKEIRTLSNESDNQLEDLSDDLKIENIKTSSIPESDSSVQEKLNELDEFLNPKIDRIFVRQGRGSIVISLNEISYIEAEADGCIIYHKEESYSLASNLKNVEELLKKRNNFVRISRKYIVNISLVESYNRQKGTVRIQNAELEVSNRSIQPILDQAANKR